ncbi:hypothetical protein V3C99_018453 [Haemonchus contortus]|uniref:Secreted protein n=1 Tax=Haemonchus contortus TaxID=6289 RepID=A0A7I4Z4S3_HAECO
MTKIASLAMLLLFFTCTSKYAADNLNHGIKDVRPPPEILEDIIICMYVHMYVCFCPMLANTDFAASSVHD